MNIRYTSNVNLADIKAIYAHHFDRQQVYAIDLAPEIISPFKFALDLAAQINQNLFNDVMQLIAKPFVTKSYESQADIWVDMEALGNVTTIKAKVLALRLCEGIEQQGIRNLLLLINVKRNSMGRENEMILYFLNKFLGELSVHIFSKSKRKPEFYHTWKPQYTIHSNYADSTESKIYLMKRSQINTDVTYSTLIEFNNELCLIECENQASIDYCERFSTTLLFSDSDNEQIAHFTLLKNSHPDSLDFNRDIQAVITYAWQCALLGAQDLSLQLLTSALETANHPTCICHYLHSLQYIRLITGNFSDATQQTYPEQITEQELTAQLHYAKGYCATLNNELDIAKKCFNKIGLTADSAIGDLDSLYRLNIYAFLMLKSHHPQQALKIEHKINAALKKITQPYTQIRYINCLNLAKLYRTHNDLTTARQCFDDAYDSIAGLLTESDCVYININYASLYHKADDTENAFYCWLRAAMHWASMRYQEALGWRPARTILKRNYSPKSLLDPAEISTIMLENLHHYAGKLHIPVNNDHPLHLIFSRTMYVKAQWQPICYHGTSHWSFIAAKVEQPDPLINHFDALTRTLTSIVLHLNGIDSFGKANCLVMDSDFHSAAPVTQADIVKRCILLGINNFSFDQQKHSITTQHRADFYSIIFVIPSPALTHIELHHPQSYVQFKRFYRDRKLNNQERKVLMMLHNATPAPSLHDCIAEAPLETLQQMAADNLIAFTIDARKLDKLLQSQYDRESHTIL